MRTVFFGPYIGEFGWEILWWHGWVKDLSRTVFRDYRKIVASFPGRYPLYPDADEFWSHPDFFCKLPISQRAYFADFWRNGCPAGNVWRKRFKYFVRPVLESVSLKPESPPPDAEQAALELLAYYRSKLPPDTTLFVPFLLNECPKYGIRVGLEIRGLAARDEDFVAHSPDFQHQMLEGIAPTECGIRYLEKHLDPGRPLICVLPRLRSVRRPDKNWPREKYDHLIRLLRARYPEHAVALLGEARGAHYDDGVPGGCLDLINVEDDVRMDVQSAALNRSAIAVGGMSGGMLFALYCGCPTLIIGFRDERDAYFDVNHLGTRLVYYPLMDVRVEEVLKLVEGMIEGMIPQADQRRWDPTGYFGLVPQIRAKVRLFLKA